MAYVDGFLVPVPTENLAAYKKMSQKAGKIWMEHGALDYKECAGDDMVSEGMKRTFPRAARARSAETVVFSWITYASKAERNRILKDVMADPRLKMEDAEGIFDPKRMIYAGFNVIVDMAPNAAPAKKSAPKKKSVAVKKKSVAKKKAKR
jgi:uncharacterized protein YbaA (DUF1428 family)